LISHGVPPLGGVKQGRGGKTSYFRAKCVNISKTVGDTNKVTFYDYEEVVHGLSIHTKVDDLGWPWTL